jgi:hypothetical protein
MEAGVIPKCGNEKEYRLMTVKRLGLKKALETDCKGSCIRANFLYLESITYRQNAQIIASWTSS